MYLRRFLTAANRPAIIVATRPGMAAGRSVGRLKPDTASLFVCDIQERFRNVIKGMPAVIDTSQRLVKAFQALEMPVFVSEQYPKALGSTVDEIKSLLPDTNRIFEKTKFSMCSEWLGLTSHRSASNAAFLFTSSQSRILRHSCSSSQTEDRYCILRQERNRQHRSWPCIEVVLPCNPRAGGLDRH